MEIFCPKCKKKYLVADSFSGKQARCKNQSCGQVFTVTARAPSAPKPAPAPAKPAARGPAMSSLLDELPPMSVDNFPPAGVPSAVATNYRPSRPKGSHKRSNSFVLLLAGAVGAVVIVGCVLALILSNRGVGGSSASAGSGASSAGPTVWSPLDYVPENAQWVAYVDLEDLRKSDLYPEIRKLVSEHAPQVPPDFDFDIVGEVFVAGCGFGPNDEPQIVLRTNSDHPLKDLLPKDRPVEMKRFQYVEYAVLGGKEGFLGKTGDRAFCHTPTEEMLKQTVERLARKERVKSDANLQTALDSVAGSRLYVAGANLKDLRMMPFPIDRFWGCVSVASSVRIEVTMVFADANQAMTCKQMIDGLSGMSAMMPPDKKKILDPIFSALKTRQNGNELHCEATWQNADFLAFLKMAKESRGMFPGLPGAFPGRPGAMPPGGLPPGAFPHGPPGGPPPVPGPPGR